MSSAKCLKAVLVSELFEKFVNCFYRTFDDSLIENLYAGNSLVGFYKKNTHLAINIIISSSVYAVLESKLASHLHITNLKELNEFLIKNNILLLLVNLGIKYSNGSDRCINIYASESNVYREFDNFLPEFYPINCLKMYEINVYDKFHDFLNKLD